MSFHHQGVLPAQGQKPPPSSSAQSTSPPLSDTNKGVVSAVDPSFMAALPEDLREMVLEEEEKMKRAVEDPASPAEVVKVGPLSILGCSHVMKANIYDWFVGCKPTVLHHTLVWYQTFWKICSIIGPLLHDFCLIFSLSHKAKLSLFFL